MFESAQQITQKCVVDKRRVCACTICGRSIFLRRSHLQSHDTKQLATGFSHKGVTTRMAASTNMFLKMHLLRSARGRHAIEIVAPPAARASQGIISSHSTSVGHPSALREPSAASASSTWRVVCSVGIPILGKWCRGGPRDAPSLSREWVFRLPPP